MFGFGVLALYANAPKIVHKIAIAQKSLALEGGRCLFRIPKPLRAAQKALGWRQDRRRGRLRSPCELPYSAVASHTMPQAAALPLQSCLFLPHQALRNVAPRMPCNTNAPRLRCCLQQNQKAQNRQSQNIRAVVHCYIMSKSCPPPRTSWVKATLFVAFTARPKSAPTLSVSG